MQHDIYCEILPGIYWKYHIRFRENKAWRWWLSWLISPHASRRDYFAAFTNAPIRLALLICYSFIATRLPLYFWLLARRLPSVPASSQSAHSPSRKKLASRVLIISQAANSQERGQCRRFYDFDTRSLLFDYDCFRLYRWELMHIWWRLVVYLLAHFETRWFGVDFPTYDINTLLYYQPLLAYRQFICHLVIARMLGTLWQMI